MAVTASRRNVLAGAAVGALILAGGGAVAVGSSGREDLVRSVLGRLIGPFAMADGDFGQMVAAIDRRTRFPQGYKLHMVSSLERAGWAPAAMAVAPTGIRDDFEALERSILTEFVTRTTFLRGDTPGKEPVVYLGAQPCSSPFAEFGMT
ncbi:MULTISPECIES: hypothetical protein [unclassified Sphingomonas]|uniref:hypothetical protein n=1 Tax=unclassified Sphingomonas TaxID=196159 RepID=UPI0006FDF805|nr:MULTISPECIES: hypothetical protein [unclassified Sphingomonas]KQX19267.1 hypothetical protein ASD17_12020 [Sphingomonas sp. Root1294]KQY65471.1 hypothetical protein ASD39_15220 [Sphingomonas sp. Root50]KRB95231.1 hypothetical protein ASE22_04840 [Sphingomonas sp. Root720]